MSSENIKISSEPAKPYVDLNQIIDADTQKEHVPGLNPELPHRTFIYSPRIMAKGIFPWHWHDDVECFYMRSGSMVYGLEREEIIFHPGDVGFLNAGELHMTKGVNGDNSALQLNHVFPPEMIEPDRNGILAGKYIAPLLSNHTARLIRIEADDPRAEKLRMLLDEAHIAAVEADFGYEYRLRHCLTQVWLIFLQAMPPASIREDTTDSQRLKQMLTWIHANYDRRFSLEELAASAHISSKECERCFRRQINTLPFDYVMDYRLERARGLLQTGNLAVTEIGLRCGFSSPSYFTSCFRKKYGFTPRQYRKQ